MNFENPTANENNDHEAEKLLKAYNCLQIGLAEKYYGYTIGDEEFAKWSEMHAKNYRQMIDGNPDLLGEFMSGDMETAKAQAFDLLHEMEEVEK